MLDEKRIHLLIAWYEKHVRDLPWRHNRTPYRVWISEIMLQQTRVQTVIEYYQNWMQRWPTLDALASASEDEVLKQWEGLGYYTRARNILKLAKRLTDIGAEDLPTTYNELRQLPGIGNYTAAAISSYCSNERVAAVDANVLRIISRYFKIPWTRGSAKDLSSCQKLLNQSIESIEPNAHFSSGKFNEACIELGALVCTSNNANCHLCPWKSDCQAHANACELEYPLAKEKKQRPIEEYMVLILKNQDSKSYAVEKRPNKGLLASLWQFPMLEGLRDENEISIILEDMNLRANYIEVIGEKKHVFSHLVWNLQFVMCEVQELDFAIEDRTNQFSESEEQYIVLEDTQNWKWLDKEEILQLSFSSALVEFRNRI